MTKGRIAVAMSGGVDSSVTAALLKERGYDVVGFSMQLYDQTRTGAEDTGMLYGRCCALDDLHDARQVAALLGIPHYIVNYERDFKDLVVRSFIDDYLHGLTPSPCVLCNSRMKFDHLTRLAEDVGAGHVATGHYAQVFKDAVSGRYKLRKARSGDKDQSYFLFELHQDQLAKAMFPLGELEKSEVRSMARRFGLPVAAKADSQEICFVPDGDYAGFVERNLPSGERAESLAGEIVNPEGEVIGRHPGIHHYTIGQRRGLGLANRIPLYVIDVQPDKRRVVAGERDRLARKSFAVQRVNWIVAADPDQPVRATVKIRSRHPGAAATITPRGDDCADVVFDEPQLAVTPGQAAVFYKEDEVLGGGWIQRQD